MLQPIIDTHVHIWDLARADYPWLKNDTSILNRNYDLAELEHERRHTNVVAGVLVQAAGNAEDTALLLEAAHENDWIKAVVGWLPLMDPAATLQLLEEKYLDEEYFKGVRHQVHDEKDPQWLLQPAVLESLQILASYDLPYDMVGVLPAHIETALRVAEKIPGLRIVFDHLNQPPILQKEKFGRWGTLMADAAKHTNFYAKVSGLGTASGNVNGWTNEDLAPYIEHTVNTFGVDRCFFGGDWPVSLLAGSYRKTWRSYEQIVISLLDEQEREKVFYTNAEKFYGLNG